MISAQLSLIYLFLSELAPPASLSADMSFIKSVGSSLDISLQISDKLSVGSWGEELVDH